MAEREAKNRSLAELAAERRAQHNEARRASAELTAERKDKTRMGGVRGRASRRRK